MGKEKDSRALGEFIASKELQTRRLQPLAKATMLASARRIFSQVSLRRWIIWTVLITYLGQAQHNSTDPLITKNWNHSVVRLSWLMERQRWLSLPNNQTPKLNISYSSLRRRATLTKSTIISKHNYKTTQTHLVVTRRRGLLTSVWQVVHSWQRQSVMANNPVFKCARLSFLWSVPSTHSSRRRSQTQGRRSIKKVMDSKTI